MQYHIIVLYYDSRHGTVFAGAFEHNILYSHSQAEVQYSRMFIIIIT